MSNYLKKQEIKDRFNRVKKLIESRNIKLSKQQKKVLLESIKLSTLVNEIKFDYEALDSRGKYVKGVVDIESQPAAINRLKDMGLFPTKVTQRPEPSGKKSGGGKPSSSSKSFRGRNIKSKGTTSPLLAKLKGLPGLLPGVGRSVSTGFTKSGKYGPEFINFSDITNRDYLKATASKTLGKGNTYESFITAVLRAFTKELGDDLDGLKNDLSNLEGKQRFEDFKKAFDDKDTGIANKIVKFIVFYEPETRPSNALRKKILAHLNKVNSGKKKEPSSSTPKPTSTPSTPADTTTPDSTTSTPDATTPASTTATTPASTSTTLPEPKITVSTKSSGPDVTEIVCEEETKNKEEEEDTQIYEDMLNFLQKYVPNQTNNLRSMLGGLVKFTDVDTAISSDKDLSNLGTVDPETGKTDSKQFNYIVELLNKEKFLSDFKNFSIQRSKIKDPATGEDAESYKTAGNCGCLFVKTDEGNFNYVLKDFETSTKISNGIDNVKKLQSSFTISKTESANILSEQVKSETNDYLDDLVDQIAFLYAHEPNNFDTVNATFGGSKVDDVKTLFKLIRLYIPKCEHYDTLKFVAKNHVTVLNESIQNKAKSLGLEITYPTALVVNKDKGIVEILKTRTSTDDLDKILGKLSFGIHILDDDKIDKDKNKTDALEYCLEKIKEIVKEVNPSIDINSYDDAINKVNSAKEFVDDPKQLKVYTRYLVDYENLRDGKYDKLNKFKITDPKLKSVFINNELKLDGVYPPFYIK